MLLCRRISSPPEPPGSCGLPGPAAYQSSTSKLEHLQANVSTVAGFTVAATPTSLSTAVGGFVSSMVTVTPVNGFNAYVSLSCTGLPINTTCTFTPVNVPADCTTSSGRSPDLYPRNQCHANPNPDALAHRPRQATGMMAGSRRYAFVFPAVFGLAGLGPASAGPGAIWRWRCWYFPEPWE